MGKTTLLAALNVFLKRQFHRLLDIEFEHISCRIGDTEITLWKFELEPLRQVMTGPSFAQLIETTKVSGAELLDFLLNDYDPLQAIRCIQTSELSEQLLQGFRWDYQIAKNSLDRIFKELEIGIPEIIRLRALVGECLNGIEIVYLPTYRRIELPLAERKSPDPYSVKRRNPVKRLDFYQGGLHSPDIYFGLSDISERLAALNLQIQSTSNNGYRAISANIIRELLDGSFERAQYNPGALPDKASLKLFFDRLQTTNLRSTRQLAQGGDIVVPDLDQIYGEGASTASGRVFLDYFLTKLASVIESTRDVEVMVENFVEHCNAYLSGGLDGQEGLFDASDTDRALGFDAKSLVLNRQNLAVQVIRLITGHKVPLDALSSGEKQIISLFARLYLYQSDMIVLIDEPELSLSLEWQQKILPDVIAAPKCLQMVAITHSPFVFENELDPFAGPLIAEAVHFFPIAGEDEGEGEGDFI